jgi:hypothetical protein
VGIGFFVMAAQIEISRVNSKIEGIFFEIKVG